ncbi:MAG: hypothetical protein E7138_07355 [Rikenellaceae bacterium]|nr:hypothetical protein [Rikenellaceae bacterium]
MKRTFNILTPLLLAAAMLSCNSPKLIPDRELGQIFHDAMLVNAYIQHNRQKELDSMNIYEPILARYGYSKEDMHYTLNKISRQKSASLGKVADYMINSLTAESDRLAEDVAKLDTIENVARRHFKKVIYQDTAIVAKVEADSALLQITIPHAEKGLYHIEANYTLDKEDKGIGRRYVVNWMDGNDERVREIANSPLTRGRKSRISLDAWLTQNDSLAEALTIDFTRFNLKKNRLKKTPLTIHDITITFTPDIHESRERLFREQSSMRIFSDTMLNLKLGQAAEPTEPTEPTAEQTTETTE